MKWKQHCLLGESVIPSSSASAWCWLTLATHLGKQEEHWGSASTNAAFPTLSPFPAGEIAAVVSFSFLSSALVAGCLQCTPFAFPLQSPSPTLPQLLLSVLRPCRSSPIPISLSSYRAFAFVLSLYSPVFNYFCFLQGGYCALLAQELLIPALVSSPMLLPMFLPILL